MLKNKAYEELGTILKTLQLLYLRVCSKIIRGANIRGFSLLHVKCLCSKNHSTPGISTIFLTFLKKNNVNQSLVSLINDNY
jgi:mannose/fructose/N-acetylgalactosamine-specific phosphotransferase system component IIC